MEKRDMLIKAEDVWVDKNFWRSFQLIAKTARWHPFNVIFVLGYLEVQ